MKDIKRIQIELTETRLKAIESIMRECGVRTKKEFLNSALTLLAWSIQEVKSGRIIVSAGESGNSKELVMKELIMLWMLYIRKNQHS